MFRVISQETVKRAQSNKKERKKKRKKRKKKAYSAIIDFLRHIKFKVIYFDM